MDPCRPTNAWVMSALIDTNAEDEVASIVAMSVCKKRWLRQNMASSVLCRVRMVCFTVDSVQGTEKALHEERDLRRHGSATTKLWEPGKSDHGFLR